MENGNSGADFNGPRDLTCGISVLTQTDVAAIKMSGTETQKV
jgi:hypothetical protein